jgi:hypothetical protein
VLQESEPLVSELALQEFQKRVNMIQYLMYKRIDKFFKLKILTGKKSPEFSQKIFDLYSSFLMRINPYNFVQ